MSEPRTLRAGVVQMRTIPDVAANLATAERLVERAAGIGAELVMLPEAFAFLGPDADKQAMLEAVPGNGPVFTKCQSLAVRHKIHLVAGFHERSDVPGKAYNTCIHLDPRGELVGAYRKIHLFDVALADGTKLNESDRTVPGADLVVTDTALGPLGLSICYDVRFPGLYQKLVDRGAVALAVPSAFTLSTGRDHWHVLLRARAIECQSYVLAAAQWGKHYGTRVSYGHALICDPWGCVVAECSDGEGVAVADLDPAIVARARTELPSLKHRRI
jgi:predicted amidohydrolase